MVVGSASGGTSSSSSLLLLVGLVSGGTSSSSSSVGLVSGGTSSSSVIARMRLEGEVLEEERFLFCGCLKEVGVTIAVEDALAREEYVSLEGWVVAL